MSKISIYKSVSIALTAIFLLIGCQNDGNSDNLSDGKNSQSEGLPSLDSSSDIKGPDANQNGVRDDIEEYIIKNYSDKKQRKALLQDARAVQDSLLVDISDIVAVKKTGAQETRSIHCIFSVFKTEEGVENPSVVLDKILSMTTNTKQRLKAYLAFNKALDGTAWALPEGDTCE